MGNVTLKSQRGWFSTSVKGTGNQDPTGILYETGYRTHYLPATRSSLGPGILQNKRELRHREGEDLGVLTVHLSNRIRRSRLLLYTCCRPDHQDRLRSLYILSGRL